jgi:hypothetical protein
MRLFLSSFLSVAVAHSVFAQEPAVKQCADGALLQLPRCIDDNFATLKKTVDELRSQVNKAIIDMDKDIKANKGLGDSEIKSLVDSETRPQIMQLQRTIDALPFRQFELSPPINFSKQSTAVPVPGYNDAKFCALTKVQVSSLAGACQVWKDPAKGWMMAATASQVQTCELICVK